MWRRVPLNVSRDDNYRVVFLSNKREIATRYLGARPIQVEREGWSLRGIPTNSNSLITHVIDVPRDVVFDSILVEPSGGDGRYSQGHLRIVP